MLYFLVDDAADKAKKEKEKFKPPSRIPGLRDAAKRMAKIVSLSTKIVFQLLSSVSR